MGSSPRLRLSLQLLLLLGLFLLVPRLPVVRGQGPDPGSSVTPIDNAAEAAPADATTETEPAPKGIPRDPIEVLYALGVFLYPLGLCSIIVVWFSIERLVVLRRGRVIPKPFVKRFFEHLETGKVDARGAIKLCEENRSPIADILASGLKKWGKPSVEVEQAIIDGGERQIGHLRKHLRVLNGASTVAPLLGLLGTVVGMIDSFNTIAMKNAMGKSEELAAGIGLALLTTAVGLLIAIPALIMYMYLAGRVDGLVMEMDERAQSLIDLISAEGLAEQARQGRSAAAAGTSTSKASEPRRAV
jgi:biopolymer transport protein ExbB